MTDPERISKRSTGLAAQLLRAGADEQPNEAGVEQTLVALGVAGAVLTTSAATSAAVAGGATAVGSAAAAGGAASGGAKAVSATLLVKWIGIGVVGGVGLAGAAAVVTAPQTATVSSSHVVAAAPQVVSARKIGVAPPPPAPEQAAPAPEAVASVIAPAPHVSAPEPVAEVPPLDVGAPLAAEVAYVDRARSLLASGQSEQGLSQLRGYESQFPEARLLPEVLFLQLETLDRLGRTSEARAAAQRLVDGFPKSPHAARARKLLIP